MHTSIYSGYYLYKYLIVTVTLAFSESVLKTKIVTEVANIRSKRF
jgi:hypothetical protein